MGRGGLSKPSGGGRSRTKSGRFRRKGSDAGKKRGEYREQTLFEMMEHEQRTEKSFQEPFLPQKAKRKKDGHQN